MQNDRAWLQYVVAVCVVVAACAGLACGSQAPAAEAKAAGTAPAASPQPPSAAAAAPVAKAAPTPPPAPARTTRAEVEFSGKVLLPKHAKGTPHLWVCDGACFAHTSLFLAQLSIAPGGGVGGELFVPQGTRLWFCAGIINPEGTIEWQAGTTEPFLAEGEGELMPPKLALTLRKGPKTPPPRPLDALE